MPVGAGRDRTCAGLCRPVPVRPVPTGAGADRNRGEIARNAVRPRKLRSSDVKLSIFNILVFGLCAKVKVVKVSRIRYD